MQTTVTAYHTDTNFFCIYFFLHFFISFYFLFLYLFFHSTVKKTFVCDDSMIITIPLSGLMNVREAQLMPETFHCVFKDFYKVFAINGRPKPLGVSCFAVLEDFLFLFLFFFNVKERCNQMLFLFSRQLKLLSASSLSAWASSSSNGNASFPSFLSSLCPAFW